MAIAVEAFASNPTCGNAMLLANILTDRGDPRGDLVAMLVTVPSPRRHELILAVMESFAVDLAERGLV